MVSIIPVLYSHVTVYNFNVVFFSVSNGTGGSGWGIYLYCDSYYYRVIDMGRILVPHILCRGVV